MTLATPARLEGLRRSVGAFLRQTHPRRELVIVLDRSRAASVRAVLPRDKAIRVVAVPGHPALGHMRNIAFGQAQGSVVCQWDDDDLSHPLRLEYQHAALAASGKPACYLQQVMQFVAPTRDLFLTNWAATQAGAHPGTLMCRRERMPRYPETGPSARLHEDLAVLRQLRRRGALHVLPGLPHLYVYVTHGHNVQPAAHHRMLVRELSQSSGLLRRREAALRDGLSGFDFGEGVVTVQGSNGPAFTLARPGPG